MVKEQGKALGKFAPLGIWLDSYEAADWVLNNGLLVGETYIGSMERCEIKRKRYLRCQRFGYLAWSCKKIPRYGHCGGPQGCERDASIAVVNTQLETDSTRTSSNPSQCLRQTHEY